jgi:hypothetical protein
MAQKDVYRHIVINDLLRDAIEKLTTIFEKYRS